METDVEQDEAKRGNRGKKNCIEARTHREPALRIEVAK